MNFPSRCLSSLLLAGAFLGVPLRAQLPEPKVKVADNTFICERPKLSFRVPSGFTYLGHVLDYDEANNQNPEVSTDLSTHVQADAYLFVDQGDPESPKVLGITIVRMAVPGWNFFDDLHDRLPQERYLEKGRYLLGATNYRTATIVGTAFTQRQLAFLVEHDIRVPRAFTTRLVEGTVTFKGDVKVVFLYAQDIPSLDLNHVTLESLDVDRRQALDAFIAAADGCFAQAR